MGQITYIDTAGISEKKVLLRADFDVSLNQNHTIANDLRIQKNIPTIKKLLADKNKVICVGHLGRPEGRDETYSLQIVADRLQHLLPEVTVTLIHDFLTEPQETFANQQTNQILVLENIRFYPQELDKDPEFAKKLASLADVFVEDAFDVCHREQTSVTEVAKLIPSYGGLALKEEVVAIDKVLQETEKPFIAIIGGAKVETKIGVIKKFLDIADTLLIGGALANTFFAAQGKEIGTSLFDSQYIDEAKQLLQLAAEKNKTILFPIDVVIQQETNTIVCKASRVPQNASIFDIGPETQAIWGETIAMGHTIVWNGPVGDTTKPEFSRGTDFLYYAITQNPHVYSLIGGGDTITAIEKEEYLEKISHISTGGGAMLEYIEKGTLPGLEVLKR